MVSPRKVTVIAPRRPPPRGALPSSDQLGIAFNACLVVVAPPPSPPRGGAAGDEIQIAVDHLPQTHVVAVTSQRCANGREGEPKADSST
jgi:hypothetical protein